MSTVIYNRSLRRRMVNGCASGQMLRSKRGTHPVQLIATGPRADGPRVPLQSASNPVLYGAKGEGRRVVCRSADPVFKTVMEREERGKIVGVM